MARGGISGVAVGGITAGGLLVYAALRGVSPLQAVREVLGGKPPGVPGGSAPAASPGAGGPAGSGGPNSWLAETALTQIGVPYRWGGASPAGFDCSGLVQWSFRRNQIAAPRTTYQQVVWSQLKSISRSQVAAGDLIFASGHVVIAISNTECVTAQHTGTRVKTLLISAAFSSPIIAYKRYVGPAPSTLGTRPASGRARAV